MRTRHGAGIGLAPLRSQHVESENHMPVSRASIQALSLWTLHEQGDHGYAKERYACSKTRGDFEPEWSAQGLKKLACG